MSSDWKHLEMEFKKFKLEDEPLKTQIETVSTKSCSCPDIVKSFSLLEVTNSKLKVKDRKGSNQLIKPARLKVIGNCYAKKIKGITQKVENETKDIEDFTSEAFLKMRISPASPAVKSSKYPEQAIACSLPSDERLPSTSSSSSLNCSTQAKLQASQLSTEFDSTIDEMSDFLAYHLSLFNHRDNLIDSMYT